MFLVFSLPLERQFEPERAALADPAVEMDFTTHDIDKILGDGGAKTGTPITLRYMGIGLGELVKYLVLRFL